MKQLQWLWQRPAVYYRWWRRHHDRIGKALYEWLIPQGARWVFDDDDEDESYGAKFFSKLWKCGVILPVAYVLFAKHMPFGFWEFWHMPSSWGAVLRSYWLFLLWGVVLQSICSFTTLNPPKENHYAERFWVRGLGRSMFAGVTEEITFRWLFFLSAIPMLQLGNWLFFGWLGFGFVEHLQTWIMEPVVNFVSLGYLKPFLMSPQGWFVGAALIATNGFFRDGHKYQGPIGYIDAWFAGLVLFHAALDYGLLCAIVVHTCFNITVHTVAYIDAVIERHWMGRGLELE